MLGQPAASERMAGGCLAEACPARCRHRVSSRTCAAQGRHGFGALSSESRSRSAMRSAALSRTLPLPVAASVLPGGLPRTAAGTCLALLATRIQFEYRPLRCSSNAVSLGWSSAPAPSPRFQGCPSPGAATRDSETPASLKSLGPRALRLSNCSVVCRMQASERCGLDFRRRTKLHGPSRPAGSWTTVMVVRPWAGRAWPGLFVGNVVARR